MQRIIGPYDPKLRVQIDFTEPGKTKQSFKDETDINKIMARFQTTGAIQHFNSHSPRYGDASAMDFREAMTLIVEAQTMFDALPSSLREKFSNSPEKFLNFVNDPANSEEMVELGLAEESEVRKAARLEAEKPKVDPPNPPGGPDVPAPVPAPPDPVEE